MALFRPKVLKALDMEIRAAHVACAMSASLPADHQQRIATTAPSEIATAARAAASAGHAAEARDILTAALVRQPKACPAGTTWDEILQAGLDAL